VTIQTLFSRTIAVVDLEVPVTALVYYHYHYHYYYHYHYHCYYYYYYYIRLMAFFRTTWVSRHKKGKRFWILMKQETMGQPWHQLNHMQSTCTSLHTDNHPNTSPLRFFTGQMPFLPPNQHR